MREWKVFLDMDGVLADFDRGVKELCGLPIRKQEIEDKAADERMWQRIRETEHFYDRLELMEDAERMFRLLEGQYGVHCEILTGIPKKKRGIITAGEDKINWIRRKLSKDIPVNVVYKEEKKNYCTGEECILIDDLARNIEEWEANGGTGILFTSVDDTIKALREKGVLFPEPIFRRISQKI